MVSISGIHGSITVVFNDKRTNDPYPYDVIKIRLDLELLSATDFKEFCETLPKHASLQILDLSDNDIGNLSEKAVEMLFTAISQSPSLQELDLSSNNLDFFNLTSFQLLCTALTKCTHLQTLNLSSNRLGELDATRLQMFCTALIEYKNLQTLFLDYNFLGKLEKALLSSVFTAFSQCANLKSLSLGLNDLDPSASLCSVVEHSGTIIEIRGLNFDKNNTSNQETLNSKLKINKAFINGLEKKLKSDTPIPQTFHNLIAQYTLPLYAFPAKIKKAMNTNITQSSLLSSREIKSKL